MGLRRKIIIVCGPCIVAFVLLLTVFFPVYNKNEIDLIVDANEINTDGVIIEYWNTSAYHYVNHTVTGNVFGVTSYQEKTVNWSYFKNLFSNYFTFMLEYQVNNGSWRNGNQYLTIDKTWNEDGYWKINQTFDNPSHEYINARFTIIVDAVVMDYVDNTGNYEYLLNYSVPNSPCNETFSCFFNFSDIAGIPGIVINHGVQDDKVYLRFRKDNVPYGVHTFDPTFGSYDESGGIAVYASGNYKMIGLKVNSSDVSGTLENITFKLGDVYENTYFKTAVYEYVDRSTDYAGELLAISENTSVASNDDNSYIVCDFEGDNRITITEDTYYYLCVALTETISTTTYVKIKTNTYLGIWSSVSGSLNPFSDPKTGETYFSHSVVIYANVSEGSTESWNELADYNITISNSSGYHQIGPVWNITLNNLSVGFLSVSEWNVSLSNDTGFQLINDFNITLSNGTNFCLVGSEYNITLNNLSVDWNEVADWNITLQNSSVDWQSLYAWNITLSNSSGFTELADWNITLSNSSEYLGVQDWNITLSNTTVESWQGLADWNITLSNSSGYQGLADWNFTLQNSSVDWQSLYAWNITLSNISGFTQIREWNISLSNYTPATLINDWNITLRNISGDIVVSNPYPLNESYYFDTQPTLAFTVSNPSGDLMNYSIFIWDSVSNLTVLLTNDSYVGNGTYTYDNYYMATELGGTYYWQVCVNDVDTWRNETFHFSSLTGVGSVVSTPGFETLFFVLGCVLISVFLYFRRKKDKKWSEV